MVGLQGLGEESIDMVLFDRFVHALLFLVLLLLTQEVDVDMLALRPQGHGGIEILCLVGWFDEDQFRLVLHSLEDFQELLACVHEEYGKVDEGELLGFLKLCRERIRLGGSAAEHTYAKVGVKGPLDPLRFGLGKQASRR